MTNDELQALLRLHTIRRWQIVEVTRPQSVAEHAFRVWALALHLYDTLVDVSHNSFERISIGQLALIHDVDEVITGDIPATVKEVLEKLSPGIMQKFQSEVIGKHFPTLAGSLRGTERTAGGFILRIADCVEAILYISEYGGTLSDAVKLNREHALNKVLAEARAAFKSIPWDRAEAWVKEIRGSSWLLWDNALGAAGSQTELSGGVNTSTT